MYATGTDTCPVRMLKLLISKTTPTATHLFNQFHKESEITPTNDVWYTNKPLSKRTFANFLPDICKAANVKRYTPHSLRATAIQCLSDVGFEARQIMFMSNHRNESSLRSYSRNVTTVQKKALSTSLTTLLPSRSLPSPDKVNQPIATYTTETQHQSVLSTIDNSAVVNQLVRATQSTHCQSTIDIYLPVTTTSSAANFFNNATFNSCTFNFITK